MKTITSRPEDWATIDPILGAEPLNAHARVAELEKRLAHVEVANENYKVDDEQMNQAEKLGTKLYRIRQSLKVFYRPNLAYFFGGRLTNAMLGRE